MPHHPACPACLYLIPLWIKFHLHLTMTNLRKSSHHLSDTKASSHSSWHFVREKVRRKPSLCYMCVFQLTSNFDAVLGGVATHTLYAQLQKWKSTICDWECRLNIDIWLSFPSHWPKNASPSPCVSLLWRIVLSVACTAASKNFIKELLNSWEMKRQQRLLHMKKGVWSISHELHLWGKAKYNNWWC